MSDLEYPDLRPAGRISQFDRPHDIVFVDGEPMEPVDLEDVLRNLDAPAVGL